MSRELEKSVIYASVDSENDITVYLTGRQCELLAEQELRGHLIKVGQPGQQGMVILKRDEEKAVGFPKDGSFVAFGIGVERTNHGFDRVGNLEVFLGKNSWETLKKTGGTGTRYGTQGSKVEVINVDQVGKFNMDRVILDDLKFYVENRSGFIKAGL